MRREGVDVSGEEGRGWCEWWGLVGGGGWCGWWGGKLYIQGLPSVSSRLQSTSASHSALGSLRGETV